MSVRLTRRDSVTSRVAMYCSVTNVAFGPIFETEDDADEFLRHLEGIGERDPRVIPSVQLSQLHDECQREREAA